MFALDRATDASIVQVGAKVFQISELTDRTFINYRLTYSNHPLFWQSKTKRHYVNAVGAQR